METAAWVSLGTLLGVLGCWCLFTDRSTQIRQILGYLGAEEARPENSQVQPS
jgi:hypothetical protein